MKSLFTGRAGALVGIVVIATGVGILGCTRPAGFPLASLDGTHVAKSAAGDPAFDDQILPSIAPNLNTSSTGENLMSTDPSRAQVAGQVEHADTRSFDQTVLQSPVPVLVDFYADWCGPCRMLAPTLEALARETSDARIVKVNVDHNPELAMRYGVSAIPSLAVFKDGQIVAEHAGLASKGQLKAMLEQ